MLNKNIFKNIIDILFPINCLNCGQEKTWICADCLPKIPQNTTHYCLNCKKQTKLGEYCSACAPRFALDKVWIAGDFQNKILSQLIRSYKYKFAQDIADPLGLFLLNFLRENVIKQQKNLFAKTTLIIPVPLHNKRLRWRGFNQSEKLAVRIATELKITQNNNLKRIKFKKPQSNLQKNERLKNIQAAFAWQGAKLDKQNIILIDDVATTGATLNECAKVLKANGATEVWGLVLANG